MYLYEFRSIVIGVKETIYIISVTNQVPYSTWCDIYSIKADEKEILNKTDEQVIQEDQEAANFQNRSYWEAQA